MTATVGFITLIALTALLLTGMPVAVAMAITGGLLIFVFISPNALVQIASITFSQSTNFVLITVPLYILMGEILASTNIGRDLFQAARLWMNRLPGSLAVATIAACAAFGGPCGSSPVTAATIGRMAVPEMLRYGYDPRLAFGAASAGGTLGILIPPSIPMVIYAVLTETSIGDLFAAGMVPGIMMALLMGLTVIFRVMRNPDLAPTVVTISTRPEKFKALWRIWPVVLVFVAIMGSMYTGLATPTEAAAVGVVGALLSALIIRELNAGSMGVALQRAAILTAMFLLIMICGLFMSYALARLGVPRAIAQAVIALDLPLLGLVTIICGLLIFLGCFMDPMSILLIVIPTFHPAVIALGGNSVWFGIIVTVTIEFAAITPPVGFNLFVLKSVVPDSKMADIAAGSAIYLVPLTIGLIMLIVFPGISLFLPNLFK